MRFRKGSLLIRKSDGTTWRISDVYVEADENRVSVAFIQLMPLDPCNEIDGALATYIAKNYQEII